MPVVKQRFSEMKIGQMFLTAGYSELGPGRLWQKTDEKTYFHLDSNTKKPIGGSIDKGTVGENTLFTLFEDEEVVP